ncbi:MAG: hypothetical protein OXH98_17250 [Caldilineaceae bacterium]|nr:hypothetical protein [Caldilineaceae bacterium]
MPHPHNQISSQRFDDDPLVALEIERPVPCYFMVADILGFSELIGNLNSNEQFKRITDWIELVQDVRRLTDIRDIRLISDTLLVREEDSHSGLTQMLKFAQQLLERGIENSFPLRGAIVHGEAAWGELTYGDAVLNAYELERSLDWLGIACSPNLPRLESMWDWNLVTVYPVARKTGPTQLVPAISWKVPASDELIPKVTGNGLIAEGDPITWEIVSKVERTIQFGMYLKKGKTDRLEPGKYRYWFPMHCIEDFQESLNDYS